MGQGQDKVARNLVDLQPTAIVELFLLYLDTIDNGTAFIPFHGGSSFANGITWQGIEYLPLPVETEGFEITANGELPRPKIKISNKDYFITDLLNKYQDLQFAKIIRKRTFVKFLDDINFDGGNPWGEADSSAEISNDTYLIGQKTAENKLFVELELTSPLDLENFEVNNRVILARYCSWYYRGAGCNYDGPPLETEEGEKLIINPQSALNWAKISTNNEWKTDVNYQVGEPVFLYNQKSSSASVSKIWYVCKLAHFSTQLLRPDLTLKYWAKDGCGKKLTNCQKRFINDEKLFINSAKGTLTTNYFNLGFLNKDNYENNITTNATIVGSSYLSDNIIAYGPHNIKVFGGNDWIANDKKATITLTWSSAQIIDQINIYDSTDKSKHIRNAVIDLYNGSTTPYERIIATNIPDNSTESTIFNPAVYLGKYIPLSSNKTVTSIRISGSGNVGNTSLGVVEVLDTYRAGLSLDNSIDKIHLSPRLHISTWIQFPGGLMNTYDSFNILHNIKIGCNYSGLNLFARNKDLVLQFAVAKTLKNGKNYSDTFVPQELIVPNWPFGTFSPLHIEIYKGNASGIYADSNNIDNEGYIKISTINNISAQYTLQKERDVVDINGKVLTEKSARPSFFKFKNPSYQGGIDSNIFWGINNVYESNKVATSNVTFGATAIWAGTSSVSQEAKINLFNRNDEYNKLYNPSIATKIPLKFSELDSLSEINLYAWWDMNLTNSAPYRILSSNSPQKILTLTGQYDSLMDYSQSTPYNLTSSVTQTPKTFLPFGGFPATDRYGR
jgi:lambda family phage minor tail protein L